MSYDRKIENVRNDFPILCNHPELIYFDSGATSLKPKTVIDKVVDFYSNYTSNVGRGDYKNSVTVTTAFEACRDRVREFVGAAKSEEIIFTSGATDSLNIATFAFFKNIIKKGDVILTTYQEHASCVLPAFKLAKENDAIVKYIPLTESGRIDIEAYEKMFDDNQIKAVFVAHISNVFGFINPIKEITAIAHKNGAFVSVDGTQSAPHIKVNVADLDVDFFSFSSHKMLGPSGVGVLYGKEKHLKIMEPLRFGGGANARFNKECEIVFKPVPINFEAGTPPIEQVLGLHAAIDYLDSIGFENIVEHEKTLSNKLIAGLKKFPNVKIHNETTDTGIVVFSFEGIFSQDVTSYLSKFDICLRGGNHCSKLTDNITDTLDTLRASLYVYNTEAEVDRFLEVCKTVTLENCIDILF